MLNIITSFLIAAAVQTSPAQECGLCACDFDGNGSITQADLVEFLGFYGATDPALRANADINCDGVTTISDYMEFLVFYGQENIDC